MLYRPGLLGRIPCPQDWYFGSGLPTVGDDFSKVLPAGWTFTRAGGTATDSTYLDGSTVTTYNTYAANTPRFLAFGLLMEPTRTNSFINSEAPTSGTKVLTLAVGTYTAWYLGAAATLAVSAGTATITGAGNATPGVPLTFQVIVTGTVSFAVLANTLRVQVENGPDATSYIPAVAAPVTRNEDRLSKIYSGGELQANQGTYWVEFMWNGGAILPVLPGATGRLMCAGPTANLFSSNRDSDQMHVVSNSGVNAAIGQTMNAAAGPSGVVLVPPTRPVGNVSRMAMSVAPDSNQVALDYTLGTRTVSIYRPPAPTSVSLGSGPPVDAFNGFIRGFRYWPVAMTDAELKECTGPGYYNNVPIVDFDFTTGVFPRRWTYTRTGQSGGAVPTDGLYTDAPGSTYNSFAAVTSPRIGIRGLLLEPSRSNFIANSAAPVSSNSATIGTQQYCLWMIGTGSITVNQGTTTTPGLPQTATQGNPVWFTPTVGGTVALTVTGSVNRAQIEQQGTPLMQVQPTSFVGTVGGGLARGTDIASLPSSNWFPPTDITYYLELTTHSVWNASISFGAGSIADRDAILETVSAPTTLNFRGNTYPGGSNLGAVDAPPATIGAVEKIAYTIPVGGMRRIAQNGQLGGSHSVSQPRINTIGPVIYLGTGGGGSGNGTPMFVRRLRIYDYAMTASQLIAVTS